jgi:hypothetical protein
MEASGPQRFPRAKAMQPHRCRELRGLHQRPVTEHCRRDMMKVEHGRRRDALTMRQESMDSKLKDPDVLVFDVETSF